VPIFNADPQKALSWLETYTSIDRHATSRDASSDIEGKKGWKPKGVTSCLTPIYPDHPRRATPTKVVM